MLITRVGCLFAVSLCVLVTQPAVSQDLFVSAAGANSVMRFDGTTGSFLGNFVAPGAGGLGDPQGIVFGPDGNLYVSSNGSNNVLRFDGQTGDFIDVFASVAGMSWPAEITFRDSFLYVSDFSGAVNRVSRFDATSGAFFEHFVTSASLPDGHSWDANGDLYLSNFGNGTVGKYDGQTGAFIENFVDPFAGGLSGALDNLFLPNGEFLVSSFNTGSVKRYDAAGNYIDDPITNLLGGPQGLLIGPNGDLFAGDFGLGVINRYDVNTFQFLGTFATTGGTSTTNNFVFGPAPIPEPPSYLLILLLLIVGMAMQVRRASFRSRAAQ